MRTIGKAAHLPARRSRFLLLARLQRRLSLAWARGLGLVFGDLPLPGDTMIGDVTHFYELDFRGLRWLDRLDRRRSA